MSRHSIHISIPAPCHESWDRMDTTERGAFCHSCRKEVIDFSSMTDREVVEYLSKNNAGCGRFRKDQVNTNLTTSHVDNGFIKWRALFLGALSFISFRSFSHSADQAKIIKTEKQDTAVKIPTDSTHASAQIVSAKEIEDTIKMGKSVLSEVNDTSQILPVATVVLDAVEIVAENVHHEYVTMGVMTKIVYIQDTIKDDTNGRIPNLPIEHPSRSQSLKAWFRHFFHLD